MITEYLNLLKKTPIFGTRHPWQINLTKLDQEYDIELVPDPESLEKNKFSDPNGFGSFISLGMTLYNVYYLAKLFSYNVKRISLNISDEVLTTKARITLIISQDAEAKPHSSKIFKTYKTRLSNKELFSQKQLEPHVIMNIQKMSEYRARIFLFNYEKNKIADILKKLTQVRFENKKLLQEMTPFSPILSPFVKLYHTTIPNDLIRNMYLFENIEHPIKYSGAIIALQENENDSGAWIRLGRKLMATWYMLHDEGISLDFFDSTLFAANFHKDKDSFEFTNDHKKTLEEFEKFEVSKINVDLKSASIFFRIGYTNID